MSQVRVEGQLVELLPGESVLEGLERVGIMVPNDCRAGTCCKCMLQADGEVPADSQRGVRPTLREQGFFLSCQAYPESELRVRSARGPEPVMATLERIETLSDDIAGLHFECDVPFDYRPGQYLELLCPADGKDLARSYSIASLPSEGFLELHVRRVPGGIVSGWLHGQRPGLRVRLRGPFGQCFYLPDELDRKLVLVGAGTGLAPLLGIVRDALQAGHRGPIDLIHGGLEPSRLYLRDELQRLASAHPQLRVHHCVLREAGSSEFEGPLEEIAQRVAAPLGAARAFLCGDDQIVRKLQRSLFLAGVPSAEILADPFTVGPAA